MNEMIKAERNKICSRKQTRMLFLAGVVLIVAYFFFFQFNYQNVFYDYDLEKMALASGFTAIEQRKEVAEIFEGKLSQNTLLTMQEKIDQAKQATVGQDENSAFSAVHVYRDQAAILEYLTNSDGSFKSLETAYPNSPTVTLGYCDGWDKLLSGMGSILSIMICLIVVITLSPVFSEEYALHTDSIIYSARYGRTKLTTSKIIAALEVVIGTYLLYLLLNLVLYGCTYGFQGWNVSIQSSLHYASSIYKASYSVPDLRFSKPSLIATSSIEEIQSRSNGFLHPALWYTNRKISSPSRPASVAHTRLATSSLAMSFFRIPNCFFVPAETSYCQSIGKIGRSA